MSQTIEQTSAVSKDQQLNEFSYRPVPVIAPVTLVLGVCSTLSLISMLALAISVLGALCGTLAYLKIRRMKGDLGGATITMIGLTLSILFLVFGVVHHSYTYATEVPDGYRRISFNQDISKKGFVYENGVMKFDSDVVKLSGQNIFLKGFMYPVRQPVGLTEFVLVKDSGKCCFGGQPKQNDMILVRMKKGNTTDLLQGRIAVTGTFKAEYPKNVGAYGITEGPIYQMEATRVSLAKNSF